MSAFVAVSAVLVGACAATQPSAELLEARNAYDRAARGPAAQVSPTDLQVARETLDKAEALYAGEGNSPDAKDMAYTATKRAQVAEAHARTNQAMQQKARASGQLEASRAQQLQTTSGELARTRESLEALTRIATVKREPRGTVITLSGSVLFPSGESTLLPSATSRLSDVAQALAAQDVKTPIEVIGHTDSQGSDEANRELSQRRAETVRTFLIAHGVPTDRVRAEGAGESQPITSNASPEGRANNRRVEIVVPPASAP